MKKNIYLFHRMDKHAIENFKLKNAILRNKNMYLETRCYNSEVGWKEFIKSFIEANNRFILENQLQIDLNFSGFILMYDDMILEKKILLTDFDKILEIVTG